MNRYKKIEENSKLLRKKQKRVFLNGIRNIRDDENESETDAIMTEYKCNEAILLPEIEETGGE